MKGFVQDIERLAIGNDDFRRVLYTATHSQLVLMALAPGEEIGAEVHQLDQFFRVEEGTGVVVMDGTRNGREIRLCDRRAHGRESQHHQYRNHAAETVHGVLTAESPRPRRCSGAAGRGHPWRGRGRVDALEAIEVEEHHRQRPALPFCQ